MLRWAAWAVLLGAVGGVFVTCASGGRGAAARQARPMVLAHYMAWYAAKPVSAAWGWHWTMGVFDPEGGGGGTARIASHYSPLIGAYDSGDPDVIEFHLLLMKLAGIDGVIVDWYGTKDLHDYAFIHRCTGEVLRACERLNLGFAVCYEDRVVPRLVDGEVIGADERVAHVAAEIAWLCDHWFKSARYVRVDGRPLLLSFGHEGLSDEEWGAALSLSPEKPAYFSEHRRRACADGAFDWPVPREYPASLERFAVELRGARHSVPVVFPRFHDIYEQAGVHVSWGEIGDDSGRTWTGTLESAMRLSNGAGIVQIATWNDWGEGTMIEPSVEFGFRDLEVLRRARGPREPGGRVVSDQDLRLAHRLFLLRKTFAAEPAVRRELDGIAGRLAALDVRGAERAIEKIERKPRGK